MIDQARRRAAEQGLGNAHFLQADAPVHPFEAAAFDVAISRTGAMFFGDAVAAFTNIGRALRPQGRIVLLVWQPLRENPWVVEFARALGGAREIPEPPPGTPGPFSLADPGPVRPVLTAASLSDTTFEAVREPICFGETVEEAFQFVRDLGFSRALLRGVTASNRDRALAELRASVDAHRTDDGVLYPSAAWVITARRHGRGQQ